MSSSFLSFYSISPLSSSCSSSSRQCNHRLNLFLILAFLLLLQVPPMLCLEVGDRVPTLHRTLHTEWKTPWLEVPLHQAPRFRTRDKVSFQASMPRPEEDKPEMKIALEEDVKISFTFADYKLVVPWTVIYDSKKGVALKEIYLTFYHDDFDVHRVDYETVFDNVVDNMLVRGQLPVVSLIYNWEALQEDDLNVGVLAMFTLTLIAAILMVSKSFWSDNGSSAARMSSNAMGGGGKGSSSIGGNFISSSGARGKRSN